MFLLCQFSQPGSKVVTIHVSDVFGSRQSALEEVATRILLFVRKEEFGTWHPVALHQLEINLDFVMFHDPLLAWLLPTLSHPPTLKGMSRG